MVRNVRKTILICGEGKADKAFLEHIRALYCAGKTNPPKVTIKQAGGKGGNNVIGTLVGASAVADYDLLIALIDTDAPPNTAARARARKARVACVEMTPCLEGFLLGLLDKAVPATSAECKESMHQVDPRDPFAEGFFAVNFPKMLLDEKRIVVQELDVLLGFFGA